MRPEHLFAGVHNCCNVRAGLLALLHLFSEVIHSGATARDSHPLPYSPRFYARHLNVSERSAERRSVEVAETYHSQPTDVKAGSGTRILRVISRTGLSVRPSHSV
jgi:hypothetical protein